MSERTELPLDVVDALLRVVGAASCKRSGRAAVAKLALALDGAGMAGVAGQVHGLAKPEDGGDNDRGWLDRMEVSGGLAPSLVKAGREIQRAVAALSSPPCAPGLRAVDTTRLVVDGGAIRTDFGLGGVAGADPAVQKLGQWRERLAGLGVKLTTVRGSKAWVDRADLVLRVLGGEAPFSVDVALGIRRGTAKDVVVTELERWVRMFGA